MMNCVTITFVSFMYITEGELNVDKYNFFQPL